MSNYKIIRIFTPANWKPPL